MSKSDSRIRVLIVDDHAMVRQGLRMLLELQDTSALPGAKKLMSAVAATESENGLTDREHEVLHLIADGMNNRDIGARLVISEKTSRPIQQDPQQIEFG